MREFTKRTKRVLQICSTLILFIVGIIYLSWNHSIDGLMPHSHCIQEDPYLMKSWVVSNAIIFLSYISIPVSLFIVYRETKKKGTFSGSPFILLLFVTFIILCGFTHASDIVTLYEPEWYMDSYIRIATAIASSITAICIIPFARKAIERPTKEEFAVMENAFNEKIGEAKSLENQLAVKMEELKTLKGEH